MPGSLKPKPLGLQPKRFEFLHPRYVIAVQNLENSSAYYKDILGFEVRQHPDPGWRFFVREKVMIMAGECPDSMPASETGDHSYFAYILVKNLDKYFTSIKEKGALILKEITDEPWGMRECAVKTPDGHRIMFGEALN